MSSVVPVDSPPLPSTGTNTTAVSPSSVNTTTTPSPPTFSASPPPPVQTNNNKTTLIALGVGIGIGGAFVLVFVAIFMFWYRRKRRHSKAGWGTHSHGDKGDIGGLPQHWQQISPPPTVNVVGRLPKPTPPHGIASSSKLSSKGTSAPTQPFSVGSNSGSEKPHLSTGVVFDSKNTFTYEELDLATGSFTEANLLGQGGFGYVHKGVLPNGKEVAVKQLKVGSGQGEREFQAEVETINRVHHKHLVSLVGYCISGTQRMLVYEFVPNNTLEFHIHERGHTPIDWETRMKVALGSAKGLAYLHEDCQPKIVHRDIKSSNILLDGDFEPKVADFGLARFYSENDTHVSTRVMGTFGYLAPEYALTGKLTEKSDVFSFGVLLLELITGRRPIDKSQFLDDNIVDWARTLLTQALDDDNFDTLADVRLQNDYDIIEMRRMVACASVCVRHLARRRPQMSQIACALEGNLPLEDLNEGIRPGHSTIFGSQDSSDYDSLQYKEDLHKFRKMALEGQLNNSSGCSGPTSEFGQHISASSSEGVRTTQESVKVNNGEIFETTKGR